MIQILLGMATVFAGYLIGSIPFGMLIVKSKTGKDIRQVESGRTGGTNAVRAAGFWAGLLTAILDIAKGAASVWLAADDHACQQLDPYSCAAGCHPWA